MSETIAAVSTAFGEGGIGIIRISGSEAAGILQNIFVPAHTSAGSRTLIKSGSAKPGSADRKEADNAESAGRSASDHAETAASVNSCSKEAEQADSFFLENRKLTYGKIVDPADGSVIDEVLAVFMKGPATYTCEDVAEINCHGSVVSLRKTLALCFAQGARPAEPGEFTKRAFLNGRLDLSQAEAVMDMISAKTGKTFDVALDQLSGSMSARVSSLRKELLDILVNIAVNIDYPDEDIEEIVYADMIKSLSQIGDEIGVLIDTADTGRIIREGLRISIVGKPNVGKSSLLNALLRESRAIVTEIPGTTRDTIEEAVSIRNIPVILTDTAGIRDTDDAIEKIGIEKSKDSFNNADLVIVMIDASSPLSQEDRKIIEYASGKKTILLANKQDSGSVISEAELREMLPEAEIIETSMKEENSISAVEDKIEQLVFAGRASQENSLMVTSARHENLLRQSKSSINDAIAMAKAGEALDFIDVDVNKAYETLGEIIGESVNEDIIDEVFSRFCLGK